MIDVAEKLFSQNKKLTALVWLTNLNGFSATSQVEAVFFLRVKK